MASTKTRRPAPRATTTGTEDQPLMTWTRNRTIIAAAGAAVAAAGAALFAYGRRARDGERPAVAHRRGKTAPGPGAARSAGPEAMRDPPEEWERTDQASDESFPASDPPPVNSRVD